MDLGGAGWAIMNILGPLLLVVVIAWALIRNRKAKGSIDRSEKGAHDVYDREESARRSGDDRTH